MNFERYIHILVSTANVLSLVMVVAIPFKFVLRKADEGELDTANALVAVVFFMGLMALAACALGTPWILAVLAGVVWFFVTMPWIGSVYTRKLHRQLDERFFEKCRLAIEFDPHNAGSHALLADACAHERRHSEAVTYYEKALTLSPDPIVNTEYDKWVRRLEAQREAKRKSEALFPWLRV